MKSDTKNIKSLGSGKTTYATTPSKTILETFKNQHRGIYLVPFAMERDEFTSLCPKTGQPDQARMEFIYVPNEKMVESKSLKLYYFSFRNTGEFHEDVTNRIAKDLYEVLSPKYLRVYADFAPRGGIAIRPIVEMWGLKTSIPEASQIEKLVNTWDIKK